MKTKFGNAKISESCKGKTFSEEHKMRLSESRNTTGYFRVSKQKDKTCNQGFIFVYKYYDENGNRKSINSVDIEKLEYKVRAKGLKWKKFKGEDINEPEIVFKIDTFPLSEKFHIFRVFNGCIWQVISPKAYNIDTGEIEYFDFIFDDMVTVEIICDMLNEEIGV